MGHVVRRSELYSGESSPIASPISDGIKDIIPFEFIEQPASQNAQDEEDEDEMDFCLFAPTPRQQTRDSQPISRIRLKSPTPTNAEPGLENPHRDQRYYFAEPLGPQELSRLESIAVSGEDVKALSRSYCPGSSYPWKVQHIQATRSEALLLAKANAVYDTLRLQQGESSKRKRPGKQSRIKSRTKLALAKVTELEEQKAAELKEIAEREKRTRRNREKKAKKKVREKAKKAAERAGGEGDDAAAESEGSDGSGDDDDASQPG